MTGGRNFGYFRNVSHISFGQGLCGRGQMQVVILNQILSINSANRRTGQVPQRAAAILEVVLFAGLAYILARFILLIAFGASAGDFAQDQIDPRNSDGRTAALEFDLESADFSQLFADRRRAENVVVQVAEVPETQLNLVLRGIRMGQDPQSGRALIQVASAGQSFVSVGEEITDGVELSEVHPDYVLISRRGIIESLYIREAAAREAASTAVAPAPTESEPEVRTTYTPRQIANARGRPGQRIDINGLFQVEPRYIDNTIVGYAFVAGNRSLLESVGLRMNDILVDVAGQPVADADQIEDLFNRLRGRHGVQIGVVRSGIALTLTVELP